MKQRIVTSLVAISLALTVTPTYAHGIGERYDLPIPLNYFIVGATVTVFISFVLVGLFVRVSPNLFSYPRYNILKLRILSTILTSHLFLNIIRVISAVIFLLTISTALWGTSQPIENFAPTFVWIIWWVGMAYLSALFGNLWMLVNPWKIIYEWIEKLFTKESREEIALFPYPHSWSVWPAFFIFFVFVWVENAYSGAIVPLRLGGLITIYSLITWIGMLTFGKHTWLKHGEAFSILFNLFARFSPTEVRVRDSKICFESRTAPRTKDTYETDCYECFEVTHTGKREINIRPYAVGLVQWKGISTGMTAFILLVLSTVTFDGLSETSIWINFRIALFPIIKTLQWNTIDIIDTMGLILIPTLFFVVYLAFCWLIKYMARDQSNVLNIAKAFIFSMVPIALGYNFAHYTTLLLFEGQGIVRLVSDPFGSGGNFFGTSDFFINRTFLNAKFIWFFSIIVIVIGHVISVYIAHIISLLRYKNRDIGLRSQYPMLILMVLYTAASLWIIAQPIVN